MLSPNSGRPVLSCLQQLHALEKKQAGREQSYRPGGGRGEKKMRMATTTKQDQALQYCQVIWLIPGTFVFYICKTISPLNVNDDVCIYTIKKLSLYPLFVTTTSTRSISYQFDNLQTDNLEVISLFHKTSIVLPFRNVQLSGLCPTQI